MSTRLAILAALLVAMGCARHAAMPIDLTGASEAEMHRHLGHAVTLRGPFSLRGKVGPFIRIREQPVYLVSKGDFQWGERFDRMEGRDVSVTGTLQFAHYPEISRNGMPLGRPSDHFYFEAASSTVELIQQ